MTTIRTPEQETVLAERRLRGIRVGPGGGGFRTAFF